MRQDIDVNWPELVAVLINKLSPNDVVNITHADVLAVQTRFDGQAAVLQTIQYADVPPNDLEQPLISLEVVPYQQALRDNESMGELH